MTILSVITANHKWPAHKKEDVIVIDLTSSKMIRTETPVLPENEKLRVAVAEQLDRLDVTEVGIDGDGTLWKTPEVYSAAIREAVEILVDDPENIKLIHECDDYLRSAIGKMRAVYKVNPLIMEYSTLAVAVKLGRQLTDERVGRAIDRARKIFSEDKFELFDEAEEVLLTLGKPILYTHAGEEWTWRKITETEIGSLLDEVVCMDVNRHKRDQWEGWLMERGIDPNEFLMIGDNLHEEVLPILALGGRAIFVDYSGNFGDIYERLNAPQRQALASAINAGLFASVSRFQRIPEAILWMK